MRQFSASQTERAHLISHFWMTASEIDSAKMARNIFHQCTRHERDGDYREEVGQCAYANTFNRTFVSTRVELYLCEERTPFPQPLRCSLLVFVYARICPTHSTVARVAPVQSVMAAANRCAL